MYIVKSISSRVDQIKQDLGKMRSASTSALEIGAAACSELMKAAFDEFARRRHVAARWRKLALAALAECTNQRALVEADLAAFNDQLAAGWETASDLPAMAHRICRSAQRLGNCMQVSLYVQDVRAGVPHEAASMLYRLQPEHPSQAELAASDSMVLSSPACAVPLASIAGEAISRGETIHLTEGAYAHNSYSYRADALPGMPPPDVLLMVPLRAGMDLCATLRLALPRALPGHSAAGGAGAKPRCFTSGQIAALEAVAPSFAMALASCFAAAGEQRSRSLSSILGSVSTLITPQTQDSSLSHITFTWANEARVLLNADYATIYLYDKEERTISSFERGEGAVQGYRGTSPALNLSIDVPEHDAVTAVLAAARRSTINVIDAQNDLRCLAGPGATPPRPQPPPLPRPRCGSFVPSDDEPEPARTVLAVPFFSGSSGAFLGVCEVAPRFEYGGREPAPRPRLPGGPARACLTARVPTRATQATNKRDGKPFSSDDASMLATLLQLAALAIENRVLRDEHADAVKDMLAAKRAA